MFDYDAFRAAAFGKSDITLADLTKDLSKSNLHTEADRLYDAIAQSIADTTDADVVFVPSDPHAKDDLGKAEEAGLEWTLGHVIVHLTASQEESAALSTDLARGIAVTWRSRYETDWQTIQTATQIRTRLADSRRMLHAFLDAWPNEPHLDVTYIPFPNGPTLNAISRFYFGLFHTNDHVEQVVEITRQAKAARGA